MKKTKNEIKKVSKTRELCHWLGDRSLSNNCERGFSVVSRYGCKTICARSTEVSPGKPKGTWYIALVSSSRDSRRKAATERRGEAEGDRILSPGESWVNSVRCCTMRRDERHSSVRAISCISSVLAEKRGGRREGIWQCIVNKEERSWQGERIIAFGTSGEVSPDGFGEAERRGRGLVGEGKKIHRRQQTRSKGRVACPKPGSTTSENADCLSRRRDIRENFLPTAERGLGRFGLFDEEIIMI